MNTNTPKIPIRLEAWDAEQSDDGWALDLDEVKNYLTVVYTALSNKDYHEAESLLKRLLDSFD